MQGTLDLRPDQISKIVCSSLSNITEELKSYVASIICQ